MYLKPTLPVALHCLYTISKKIMLHIGDVVTVPANDQRMNYFLL